MTGVLKVRTTKAFGESTVSKILELMENSSSHKSRSESFISRFAKVYTPAVCYSALALAILPPLALTVSGADADWGTWVYRALTFLVISCPCALVISIPLSFFAGLGGAGKEGVLIKGSNYLEALSQTKTVVFDKTGTLTQGVFEVSAVHHSPMAQEKLLEYAALAECASSHPISKSLQKAAGGALDRSRVTDIQEHSGRGVTAVVDGVTVAAGNGKLMEELGVAESGLHKLIKASYTLLGLISFLTAGSDECRAWTIKKGTKAPQAAGKIHTDFERGFIRAEVIAFDDMKACGTMAAAKAKGLVRSEGKEYVMKDGDIVNFLFNV